MGRESIHSIGVQSGGQVGWVDGSGSVDLEGTQ